MTGQAMAAVFRAPGGKTSPALLAAARRCGWTHVGWSPAGFLGDELPSDKYPNDQLLQRALRDIRSGDILLAHLGIWSRQDPWAPAVLEPLIAGLKSRGFCFATLREPPAAAVAARPARPPAEANVIDAGIDLVSQAFGWAQQALFEAVVQPLAFALGLGNLLEDGLRRHRLVARRRAPDRGDAAGASARWSAGGRWSRWWIARPCASTSSTP